MSLLPFFMEYERPRRHLCVTPQGVLFAVQAPPQPQVNYHRPWRQLTAAARDLASTIKQDKDKFQVSLDVQHFAPEEISVKTADGYVVVEGRHEERRDEHGFVSRQFTRRYALPEGCEPAAVESRLSSDGVLMVVAPRRAPPAGERIVPLERTGPVRTQPADTTPVPANTTPIPADTTPVPANTTPIPADSTPMPADSNTRQASGNEDVNSAK